MIMLCNYTEYGSDNGISMKDRFQEKPYPIFDTTERPPPFKPECPVIGLQVRGYRESIALPHLMTVFFRGGATLHITLKNIIFDCLKSLRTMFSIKNKCF